MALSQLRPMVIEGDRPAPVDTQSGFTKLPDGSLIMRGTKPVEAKPGMLAGLRSYIAEKLNKPNSQRPPDQWWIPPPAPSAPVSSPSQPAPLAPGAPLPPYSTWGEIEDMVAREQRIKDELGGVSKAIMNSPALIEGKWGGGR